MLRRSVESAGVKRTSQIEAAMSAYDPKQTLRHALGTGGGRNLQSTDPGAVVSARLNVNSVRLRYWIYQASMSGDPVARTRWGAKSAEITHAAIWPSDLHAPHAALSHDR